MMFTKNKERNFGLLSNYPFEKFSFIIPTLIIKMSFPTIRQKYRKIQYLRLGFLIFPYPGVIKGGIFIVPAFEQAMGLTAVNKQQMSLKYPNFTVSLGALTKVLQILGCN